MKHKNKNSEIVEHVDAEIYVETEEDRQKKKVIKWWREDEFSSTVDVDAEFFEAVENNFRQLVCLLALQVFSTDRKRFLVKMINGGYLQSQLENLPKLSLEDQEKLINNFMNFIDESAAKKQNTGDYVRVRTHNINIQIFRI